MNNRTMIYLLPVRSGSRGAGSHVNTKVADVAVIGIVNNYSGDEPSSVRLLYEPSREFSDPGHTSHPFQSRHFGSGGI